MEKFILAIDSGTSSCRSVLIDKEGKVVASAQEEIQLLHPEPGWIEQNPNEIWEAQEKTIYSVINSFPIDVNQIEAIGITNQRETTVAWNSKTGEVFDKAISWQDKRTKELCSQIIDENYGDLITSKTGLVVDTYFSASKMKWFLDNENTIKEWAEVQELCLGNIDSFLIWKLTRGKQFKTEVSNASRTLLFNIHQLDWDFELLNIFGIKESMLPEVIHSDGFFGEAHIKNHQIPIRSVLGDQQAALFGQGCFEPGELKATLGTGAFVLLQTGEKALTPAYGLLTTVAWTIDHKTKYALEGSVFIAGAVIQWLRDQLNIIKTAQESSDIAQEVKDSEVYFVPAFSGLGTPYWNREATGLITGIDGHTDARHLIKAGLESIAYQCHDVFQVMEKILGSIIDNIFVDGGASENEYLMQFLADLEGREVKRAKQTESTILGVGHLAGYASGLYSFNQILDWKKDKIRYSSNMDQEKRLEKINGWKRAILKTSNFNT